jgi:Bacterial PH domain
MGIFRHLLIVVILGVVLRWLWQSSIIEHSKFEAGRKIFPPTRAIRILIAFLSVAFTGFFLWCWFTIQKPDEWWVPYLFLGLLALTLFIYPPALSIEVDGVGSRSWLGHEKKIRWEDIASLHFNTGNKQFVVRANDGRKITHGGFNADQAQFQHEIHERTRLPMKITRPGTWKSETLEVPYELEEE